MKDVNDCKVIEELLSPFFDEELNEDADAVVRQHLDGCRACGAKLQELKETVSAINALPLEATPEQDLWDSIATVTGSGSSVTPLHTSRKRRFKFPGLLPLAAMLAALMVPGVVVIGGIGLLRDGNRADDLGVLADVEVAPTPPAVPEPIGRVPRAPRAPMSDARVQALITALGDNDAQVRRTAARTLGDIGDQRAVEALVDALKDTDAGVRRWAAWALGEIGAGHAGVTEMLMEVLLSDPADEVRRWSAWALGEIDNDYAVPALAAALESDPGNEVRRWSAWALGEIQDERAVSGLVIGLEDSWYETRRWSAWALGEIGSDQAVTGLSNTLLEDESAEVRRWAAWALGEIGDARAEDALTKAMKDESAEVRRWAIWALGEIDHQDTGARNYLSVDMTKIFAEAVVDEVPERLSSPPLEYPRPMRQGRIEGDVLLEGVVSTAGRIEAGSVRVVSSTNEFFESAARSMLEKSQFRPGKVRGTPVRVRIQVPVSFRLQGG